MNIELKSIERDQLYRLLSEASDSETNGLLNITAKLDIEPYDFFKLFAIEKAMLFEDGRPIYMAALVKNINDEYEFWTVANKNIKSMMTICKYAKRIIGVWLQHYIEINASLPKGNVQNQKWVEWLGFKKVSEDEQYINYKIGVKNGLRETSSVV